jgi:hypothetical protein
MSRTPEAKLSAEPPLGFPVTPPLGERHEANMKIPNRSRLMGNTADVEGIFLRIVLLVARAADAIPQAATKVLITIFMVGILASLGF